MDAAVGAWPTYGEIYIIEGVHNSNATTTTLHTNLGCDQDSPIVNAAPTPRLPGEGDGAGVLVRMGSGRGV